MIRHRTKQEVRRYDLFKLIVALILLALLIFLLLNRPAREAIVEATATLIATATQPEQVAEVTETPVATVTLPPPEPSPTGEGEEETGGGEPSETAPAPPALDPPPVGESFAGGELPLTGTGEPGSEVQIIVDGEAVATVIVGEDGTWEAAVDLTEPGPHEIVVQTTGADGSTVTSSEQVTVIVAEDEQIELVIISPTDGAELPPGEVTLIGSGEPGLLVEIVDNGEVVAVAEVDDSGEWSHTLDLEAGTHQITIRPAEGGGAAAGDAITIEVIAPPAGWQQCEDGELGGGGYVVGACENLSLIAARLGVDLFDLIAANPQIQDPDLIYPGQVITIP